MISALVAIAVSAGAPACAGSDDSGPVDAVTDAQTTDATNGKPPVPIEGAFKALGTLSEDESVDLPGLGEGVHVFFDTYRIPHIVGRRVEDVFAVQGFIHARERFGQMEMVRRVASGRVAELVGAAIPGAIDQDIAMRVWGLRRAAQPAYDAMPVGGLHRRILEAYAAGVNAWMARWQAGKENIDGPFAVALGDGSKLEPWSPLDSLTLVRYEAFLLMFDADADVKLTQMLQSLMQTFALDAPDPALKARAGAHHDLYRFQPPDPTVILPEFGPKNPPPPPPKTAHATRPIVPKDAMQDAIALLATTRRVTDLTSGGEGRGSNSWAISAARTVEGAAIVANDPHLSLDAPTIWYQSHLVVTGDGTPDNPALNFEGVTIAGVPGMIIGHNEKVALGLTTAYLDTSDAFLETVTPGDAGKPDTVTWNGKQVPLEIINDEVAVGFQGAITQKVPVKIEIVPHHGPLAPKIENHALVPRSGTQAISFACRAFQPSDEWSTMVGLMTAKGAADVQEILKLGAVAGQQIVYGDTSGAVFYSTQNKIPMRKAAAMTWHPLKNPKGTAPFLVLPGDGTCDWDGFVPHADVPHSQDFAKGYVVAANNAQTIQLLDNDPLNDGPYIGYSHDVAFRAGRVTQRLDTAVASTGGKVSFEQAQAVAHDTNSALCRRSQFFFDRAIGRLSTTARADNKGKDPWADKALVRLVAAFPTADVAADLTLAQEVFKGWLGVDCEAPAAWWHPTDADPPPIEITRSAATTLLNVTYVFLLQAAFADELDASKTTIGDVKQMASLLYLAAYTDKQEWSKWSHYQLDPPATVTATEPGPDAQSTLFDDLTTADYTETLDYLVGRALVSAIEQLAGTKEAGFGSRDPKTWRWGRLHYRVFKGLIDSVQSLPFKVEGFEQGYPMPGDQHAVSPCSGGLSDFNFRCASSGATMRRIVQMKDGKIRTENVIPGGQSGSMADPHYGDDAALWVQFKAHPVWFYPEEIGPATKHHIVVRASK